jgi:putative MATE family efflux protein
MLSSENSGAPESPLSHGGRDMTTGSIPRNLIAFSLPMLFGSLLQIAYSLVNAFWVGKYLGTRALAAVTVSMPPMFVLISIAGGLTLATNILVAQYVGAKEWDKLKNVVQTSMVLVVGLSFLLLVAGESLVFKLLSLINTPADVFAMSASYLRIFLWTIPLVFAIFLMGAILRGIGDSQTPVYFQTVSVVINAALDPVLMFGWLGFPKLGVNGTAYASIIAQIFVVAGMMVYIPLRRPLVSPDHRQWRVDAETTWLLIRVGFPSMVQQSVLSVSLLFVVTFVSAFGSGADAAFGAGMRIDGVAFLPALTIGMAVSTLSGQNIGARQYDRVKEVFWWGILLSGGISLLISILVIAFPEFFLRAFLNEPKVIEIGAGYLRIVGIEYAFLGVMFVSNGIINGSGHTVPTTLISIVTLWGVRVPLAAVLPKYMNDVRGVWVAMMVSVTCGMVLSLVYYASGRWKKAVIE